MTSNTILHVKQTTIAASREQLAIMRKWRNHTGWAFIGKSEARADDPHGFLELWRSNVKWVEDNLNESGPIIKAYSNRECHEVTA